MTEREMYELPCRNSKNIDKKHFIIMSIISMVLADAIACIIIALCFGSTIVFFPIQVSIMAISIMGMAGCIYYIRKHDYAYGSIYENILRTLLLLMLISILIVPIYSIAIVILAVVILFRITRRCG